MIEQFVEHEVDLPEVWDEQKLVHAFRTKTTPELYKFFRCANSTSFSRLMKPIFPKKPDRMSYVEYVQGLLEVAPKELTKEERLEEFRKKQRAAAERREYS